MSLLTVNFSLSTMQEPWATSFLTPTSIGVFFPITCLKFSGVWAELDPKFCRHFLVGSSNFALQPSVFNLVLAVERSFVV
jgi:hypothetical protein